MVAGCIGTGSTRLSSTDQRRPASGRRRHEPDPRLPNTRAARDRWGRRQTDKQGALCLTALADTAHVTLGSISQPVRRLDELGFVAKSRDIGDRRRVLFSLTDTGREAVTASRRHR